MYTNCIYIYKFVNIAILTLLQQHRRYFFNIAKGLADTFNKKYPTRYCPYYYERVNTYAAINRSLLIVIITIRRLISLTSLGLAKDGNCKGLGL